MFFTIAFPILKYTVIVVSAFYLIGSIWAIQDRNDAIGELLRNETSAAKREMFGIRRRIFLVSFVGGDVAVLLGLFGAVCDSYCLSMVTTVLKILIFLLGFANLLRPPTFCLVLQLIITIVGFAFSFFLWVRSQWKSQPLMATSSSEEDEF